jgi:hypothetical protein
LLHNPVLTPNDVKRFARLVARRDLDEVMKPLTRDKLAGRIRLFHNVIDAGLRALTSDQENG